jgi:hypothetical protein
MVDDTPEEAVPEVPVIAEASHEGSDASRAELVAAASVFVGALSRVPGLVDTIGEVLGEYLDKPDTTEVGRRLNFALNHVIGNPGGNFVVYYLGSNDPESIISALDDVDASEEDRDFADRTLRRLQAIFGYPVAVVVQAMDENPHDWARATRKVYYDVLTSRWVFELDLEKYNGEQVHLAMSPDASTRLGAGVVLGINAIQEDVFDDEGVAMLTEEIVKFLTRRGGTVSFTEPAGGTESLTGSNRLGDPTTDEQPDRDAEPVGP